MTVASRATMRYVDVAPGSVASVGLQFRGIRMDALSLFGLFAVSMMLVTYALEDRSTWYILGFAMACAAGSVYGFLQGAWPFGLVEAIWSAVALRRWTIKRQAG